MFSKLTCISFLFFFSLQFSIGQASPWGTGTIGNQLIGSLVDTTVVFPSQSGWGNYGYYPNPNTLLPSYTYDIYIPSSYDGTEPYGLVTFINSGNNGAPPSSWYPIFDEKKLIMIAGDNIGNSVNVNIRMGVMMAAVYRLKEILNIDSTRVFSSGNSGGARMASVLAYTYPEWFFGAVPNCGSSYPRQVSQDYETQQPNGHYEYTIPFTTADLAYVKSFDRRYGILTSFDDFREGDIMNIYHNGMVEDGIKGKFLEIAGPHCTTSTDHFRDAMDFVEHPHIQYVLDSFSTSPIVGNGFKTTNAMVQNNSLALEHHDTVIARAYSRDLFQWNDAKGSIFDTRVSLDTLSFVQNSLFHIGMYHAEDAEMFCSEMGTEVLAGKASIVATIAYDDIQPTLYVVIENPNQNTESDTIFQATFSDWTANKPLDIRYHIWNQELRMEFSNHFTTPAVSSIEAKLLDDNRSIRIRWKDFAFTGSYWGVNTWKNGTFLTFASENINPLLSSTKFEVDYVGIISADTTTVLTLLEEETVITQMNDSLWVPDNLGPYQWYLNGNALPNDTTNLLIATQNGDYSVVVYAGEACEVSSDTVNILFSSLVDLEEMGVEIYPNPTTGVFNLYSSKSSNMKIEVRDVLGQTVLQKQLIKKLETFDLSLMPQGVYFIKLYSMNGEKKVIYKLIKN